VNAGIVKKITKLPFCGTCSTIAAPSLHIQYAEQ
jgi:hypothetical protein